MEWPCKASSSQCGYGSEGAPCETGAGNQAHCWKKEAGMDSSAGERRLKECPVTASAVASSTGFALGSNYKT